MSNATTLPCTAFLGARQIAAGPLEQVAVSVKAALGDDRSLAACIFDDATGRPIDLDLRGTADEIVQRLARHPFICRVASTEPEPRGPGRPKLGVVAREVTLLPRHWDWLSLQPGGASVALRKLVDEARRSQGGGDRLRRAQEATYHVMSAMAGNEPGYEEAARALFAKDRARFGALIAQWPTDVGAYVARLAEAAFPAADGTR